eukprot:1160183-Pelagomonas_calceolata.AAC.1
MPTAMILRPRARPTKVHDIIMRPVQVGAMSCTYVHALAHPPLMPPPLICRVWKPANAQPPPRTPTANPPRTYPTYPHTCRVPVR